MPILLSANQLEKVRELAASAARQNACDLYDLEVAGGGQILRVFIDKQGGVGINECSDVSNALSLLLDVENVGEGSRYELEISSPGLERVLRERRHYENAVGQTLRLTRVDADGRRATFEGLLKAVDDEGVQIETAAQKVTGLVPWSEVEKARTIFDLKRNPPPGKGGKK